MGRRWCILEARGGKLMIAGCLRSSEDTEVSPCRRCLPLHGSACCTLQSGVACARLRRTRPQSKDEAHVFTRTLYGAALSGEHVFVAEMNCSRNWSRDLPSRFYIFVVDVTPHPVLAGLVRLNNGMVSALPMMASVLAGGRIATAHVSTNHAHAQLHPVLPRLQALLTAGGRGFHLADVVHMLTSLSHNGLHILCPDSPCADGETWIISAEVNGRDPAHRSLLLPKRVGKPLRPPFRYS